MPKPQDELSPEDSSSTLVPMEEPSKDFAGPEVVPSLRTPEFVWLRNADLPPFAIPTKGCILLCDVIERITTIPQYVRKIGYSKDYGSVSLHLAPPGSEELPTDIKLKNLRDHSENCEWNPLYIKLHSRTSYRKVCGV